MSIRRTQLLLLLFVLLLVLAAIAALSSTLVLSPVANPHAAPRPHFLRVPAVVGDGRGGSQFQCWRLGARFATDLRAGVVGGESLPLGDLGNASYTWVPAGHRVPQRTSRVKQFVFILSGGVVYSLPESDDTATVTGGPNGFVVTSDVEGTGHIATYSADEPTVMLEMPFPDGRVPKHAVIRENGACTEQEQISFGVWDEMLDLKDGH